MTNRAKRADTRFLPVRRESGQGLVEVAVMVPLLAMVLAYAIDFGYFFIVAADITSAAKNAAEYSVQGYLSPAQATLPSGGPLTTTASVSALALSGLNSLLSASTTASIQVCSKSIGTSGNTTTCSGYGAAGSSYTPATDPEAPRFMLHRVDVTYTVKPPIPLSFFHYSLLPSLAFHRQVSMRALD